MKKSHLLIIALALLSSLTATIATAATKEDDTWEPTAHWPFVYKDFQTAIITTSAGQKVRGEADIHVGFHYLCYENKQHKKLAAKEGTINCVEFTNGDVFMAVENKLCKVICQDTIEGEVCRVYRSDELDRARFDELARINNMGMTSVDLGLNLNNLYNKVADVEGSDRFEENPLPMNTYFYMLYKGETFLVNETNILKHIDKKERAAYRAFTRKAEIIYSNQKSVLDIWSTFIKR